MTISARNNVDLRWAQQQAVPLDGTYSVYGGIGAVSYAAALLSSIPAWPSPSAKCGWGLGTWGGGAWGIGQGGLAWGEGNWGLGTWGQIGGSLSISLADLADGTWKFSIVGADGVGNVVTPAAAEATIILAGTPRPPTTARASYVAGTGIVTIFWTKSPDDQ